MPEILRTAQSRVDYLEIYLHIARDNPDAARRLIRRFDEKLDLIASMPGIGAERDELRAGLRSFPVGNYLIFYRQTPSGIELLRVIHGARDLRKLFSSR